MADTLSPGDRPAHAPGGCDDAPVRRATRSDFVAAIVLSVALGVPAVLELPATRWTGYHGTPRALPVAPLVLDVNLATPGMLTALPGVGPVLARRIAAERENMPFSDAGDLARTHGVGPATVERLRPYLRFGPTR